MENPVSQRITHLVNHFTSGNEKKFAESLGVKPAVINNYTNGKQQSKPSFDVVLKIIDQYPDVNVNWLYTGRGNFLNAPQASQEKIMVITHDIRGNMTVPVMNYKAAANYLSGYNSQEVVESSDSILMPSNLLKRGTPHAAIQVSGDSMQPTLHNGDYVICRFLDRAEWVDIADGEVCVVASANEGLQVKRLENRLKSGYLTCISDNKMHRPFDLRQEELVNIWQVMWKMSQRLDYEEEVVFQKLSEIENRLEKLKGKLPA